MARRLRALGVGPGDLVGLFVERSLDMVVGLVGVLKSGRGLRAPRSRVSRGAAGLHRRGCRRGRDPDPGALGRAGPVARSARAVPRRAPRAHSGRGRRARARRRGPEDLAYVIYTSGSAGRPKGVADPAPRRGRTSCARCRARPRAGRVRPTAGGDHAVVRHRGPRAVPAADGRRRGWWWRAARRPWTAPAWPPLLGAVRRHRDAGHARDLAAAARRRLGGRSGLHASLCGGEALPRELAGAAPAPMARALEPVRADRDDDLVERATGSSAAAAACRSGSRIANTAALRAGRPHAAGAGRSGRRALHRRRRRGARLPQPARPDRRAVRRRSLRRDDPAARLYRTGDLARCRAGRASSSSSAGPITR